MENTKLMPEFITKKIADLPAKSEKRRNKMSFKAKLKVALVLAVVLLIGLYWVAFTINKFFNENELKFQNLFQKPVWIEKRVPPAEHTVLPVAQAKSKELPVRYRDQWDEYTYNLFGKDGDLAVKIFRAENGTGQCDRYNVNKNGSIDIGRAQINSTHFKRVPLADLVDCKKNIDFAHTLYTEQKGFGAWSQFNNGNYKLVDLKNYLN